MNKEQQLQQILAAFNRAKPAPAQSANQQPTSNTNAVAIIGLSGRFPMCESVEQFWQALTQQQSKLQPIPSQRFDWQQFYQPSDDNLAPSNSLTINNNLGGFIDNIAGFDREFFKLSSLDAARMDPRQRLLLMSVYHTLENAGYNSQLLQASTTGLYIAHQDDEYQKLLEQIEPDAGQSYGQASQLANYIAYHFDFNGPSQMIDAQCAGAAVAIHRAVCSLRNNEINQAIVAGVNLLLRPHAFASLSRNNQLTSDSTIRSFQDNATGHIRAEGVASIMLKPLAAAIKDQDHIYALIENSAINFNGRGGASSAAPDIDRHSQLVAECYANVDPRDIGYIEAQGMGNPLSDIAEWHAFNRGLQQVAKQQGVTIAQGNCQVSTLKPMFGHMESCSALGALFKIIYSINTGTIFPIHLFTQAATDLNYDNPSRVCSLSQQTQSWPANHKQRLAGLHSFGVSGNNVHLLIGQYRAAEQPNYDDTAGLILLSALSFSTLQQQAKNLCEHLNQYPDIKLADVAYTLFNRRERLRHKVLIRTNNLQQLKQQLLLLQTAKQPLPIDTWQHDICYSKLPVAELTTQNVTLGRKIPLPGYPFDLKPYWLEQIKPITTGKQQSAQNIAEYLQQALAQQIEQKPQHIDLKRHLQDYGLDSLAGMKLLQGVSEAFAIKVHSKDLLEYPTIARLSAHLANAKPLRLIEQVSATAQQIQLESPLKLSHHNLSQGQKGLWVLQKSQPQMSAYNIPLAFALKSADQSQLNQQLMAQALKLTIQQHPILGAKIELLGQQPQLIVTPNQRLNFEYIDATTYTTEQLLTQLEQLARRPIDIDTNLLNTYWLQQSKTQAYLLINIHHLIFDSRSFVPLLSSLFDNYRKLLHHQSTQKTADLSYFEYSNWQQQQSDNQLWQPHQDYWLQQLAGPLPVLALASDYPRAQATPFAGALESLTVPDKLAQQIKTLCLTERINPSTLFLALFNGLLHHYSSKDDIIVGVPNSVRPGLKYQQTIGYFVNMLPIRSRQFAKLSLLEFVHQLKYTLCDAIDHSDLPFNQLVQLLDIHTDVTQAPVFQVAYEYQNGLTEQDLQQFYQQYSNLFELEFIQQLRQQGEYELLLEVTESEQGFELHLKYNPSLFEQQTAINMLENFIALSYCALSSPQSSLSQHQLGKIKTCHATNDTLPQQHLIALISKQVEQYPQAIAISDNHQKINYLDLQQQSDQLAKLLVKRGLQPQQIVAVCLDRQIELVVSLLAILKAGGAYLPLDPNFPPARLQYMLTDANCELLISQQQHQVLFATFTGSIMSPEVSEQLDNVQLPEISLEQLAYVIYTSGSTGKPKGVMIEHLALSNFITSMANTLPVDSDTTMLALTTISFDIAGLELFLPLATGGHCALVSTAAQANIDEFKQQLAQIKPNIIQATPSFWSMLLNSGWQNSEQLTILSGGERLTAQLQAKFNAINADVWNLYGPTETTIWSSIAKMPADGPIHIGQAIDNTELYILDSYQRQVPTGVVGELCIAGAGLSRGYLNQPQLNAEKFVEHHNFGQQKLYHTGDLARMRNDGNIELLGRIDNQVKIRGYRIELDDIAEHISHHTAVNEAVVVAKKRHDNYMLVAYYTSQSVKNQPLVNEQIQQHLAQQLPPYMLPQALIPIDKLPMTANGKIDSKALAQRDIDHNTNQLPAQSDKIADQQLVQQVSKIWQQLLAINSIDVNQGFFAAGGDSVLAVILVERIAKQFELTFNTTLLFKYSTIAQIADYIANDGQITTSDEQQAAINDAQPVSLQTKPLATTGYDNCIAVIGIACQFPDADHHLEFWHNIMASKDSGRFFTPDQLTEFDLDPIELQQPNFVAVSRTVAAKKYFDADFFNISPRNALLMDPQFRMLLMHSYKAIEDAGYMATDISDTAVFMSASHSGYHQLLQQAGMITPTDYYSAWMFDQGGSIPTMISHQLGLTAASMFIHTNCSSSLACINAGYQSLLTGQSQYALVGASTLLVDDKPGYLHRAGLNLSSDGYCRAFDAKADGMVSGEGSAVLLLKRSTDAINDNDHIYGHIRGIGINNDGKQKAGFFAPSVQGQTNAISQAIAKAQIDVSSIQYIETHGTGTKIGDPIEIQALTDAYKNQQTASLGQYCAIGSVKPNIGHLDTAAGLAGCIKVLLGLKHKIIPPSIHYHSPNPAIDFAHSPFYVNTAPRYWHRGQSPRRAGLSAFGIGGTNVHMILEQARQHPVFETNQQQVIIVLSAKDQQRLDAYIEQLTTFLNSNEPQRSDRAWLAQLAYTLQCGRIPMNARAAFVVDNISQLIAQLNQYQPQISNGDQYEAQQIEQWLAQHQLDQLAQAWLQGADIPWQQLYQGQTPGRISAPTYPFAQQLYWPAQPRQKVPTQQLPTASNNAIARSIHFSGDEFFLADHQVIGEQQQLQKILPAVIYLDQVLQLAQQHPQQLHLTDEKSIVLENIQWVQPAICTETGLDLTITIEANGAFALTGANPSNTRYCIGSIQQGQITTELTTLAQLKTQLSNNLVIDDIYSTFAQLGISFGAGHQSIKQLTICDGQTDAAQALALLELPSSLSARHQFALHPSILDGALQTCLGLFLTNEQTTDIPLLLPSSLQQFEVFTAPVTSNKMWAWARFNQNQQHIDINLYNENGDIVAKFIQFTPRQSVKPKPQQLKGHVIFKPVWQTTQISSHKANQSPTLVIDSSQQWAKALVDCQHTVINTLESQTQPITANIIWLAAITATDDSPVEQLFAAIKTLIANGAKQLKFTVVTINSIGLRQNDVIAPHGGAMHGLLASLSAEYPNWNIGLFDLDSPALPPLEQLVANTHQSDSRGLMSLQVRRNNQWFKRQLLAVMPEVPNTHIYKHQGVYVIVGGAGGLGRYWTQHLLSSTQAQVVWIGRKGQTPQIEQALQQFDPQQRPIYIRADAKSITELQQALQHIEQHWGTVTGVIHAPLQLHDQNLSNMSEAQFSQVLKSKTDTIRAVAQVFGHQGLDFLLVFSSMISFGQAAGQANYAAACTYLDSFVQQLNQTAPYAVKLINWGYWGTIGSVANQAQRQRMLSQGIDSIEPAQGMAVIEQLLAGQDSQLAFINLADSQKLEKLTQSRICQQQNRLLVDQQTVALQLPATISVSKPALIKFNQWYQDSDIQAYHLERDQLVLQILAKQLSGFNLEQLTPTYQKWLRQSKRLLNQATTPVNDEVWTHWQQQRQQWQQIKGADAELELLEQCLKAIPDILNHQKTAQDVIFPNSSLALVSPLYYFNPIADLFNDIVSTQVVEAVKTYSAKQRRLKILEVGAGTGATSAGLLTKLQPFAEHIEQYCYTDVSKVFLLHGDKQFGQQYPFITTKLFDIQQPIEQQGIDYAEFDIVVATNVIHATNNIRQTLRHIKAAMKNNGLIFINEISQPNLYAHLTFGLLEHWWQFNDYRIEGSPAMDGAMWTDALNDEGFALMASTDRDIAKFGHQILVASSDGVIRQHQHIEPVEQPKTCTDTPKLTSELAATIEQKIIAIVIEVSKISAEKIKLDRHFADYGIDSILQVEFIERLSQWAGELPNTLLFEHSTINELSNYLQQHHSQTIETKLPSKTSVNAPTKAAQKPSPAMAINSQKLASENGNNPIAIIGMAGRYPNAETPQQLWQLLLDKQNAISGVDASHWPYEQQQTEQTFYGGFLAQTDCFDSQLFNLSAEHAATITPETRQFMEVAWQTFASAGYNRLTLNQMQQQNHTVGVFVGAMYDQYASLHPSTAEANIRANGTHWQIANQVSHYFDLQGPSLVLDTACSSSLTAIHLACESLAQNTCAMALAGGVNLTLSASKFASLQRSGFLSSQDSSRSFGDSDGMLPGEGVGAVLLKPLAQAQADHDNILALINSSFINHSGGRQAFTAPDPLRQAELISQSIERSGIDINTISYVESAANGSALGDPIELLALNKAFSDAKNNCAIGAIKSNIGHLEAASGISQLTKVVLQLQHQILAPTIHTEPLNPKINWQNSPFDLQTEQQPWRSPNSDTPLCALINSFGAGGAYANLIVSQFQGMPQPLPHSTQAEQIVVTGACEYSLKQNLAQLHHYITTNVSVNLAAIAAISQYNYQKLDYREVYQTNQVEQLLAQLQKSMDTEHQIVTDDIQFKPQQIGTRQQVFAALPAPLPDYAFDHRTRYFHQPLETLSTQVHYQHNEPLLADHQLDGEQVVLGLSHVSVALNHYFEQLNCQALCIEKLLFVEQITVPTGHNATVNLTQNGQQFNLTCADKTVATGKAYAASHQTGSYDIHSLVQQSQAIDDIDTIYQTIAAITLGSSHKTITELYQLKQNQQPPAMIAKVAIGMNMRNDQRFGAVHPLVLNSGFLAAGRLIAQINPQGHDYIPFAIKQIHCFSQDSAEFNHCWVYCYLEKYNQELISFSFDIISNDNQLLASLKHCSLKKRHNNPTLVADIDDNIEQQLVTVIEQTCQLTISEKHQDTNLMALGLDSAALVALTATIAERWQLDVDPTLLFEYPSINELTTYIAEQLKTVPTLQPRQPLSHQTQHQAEQSTDSHSSRDIAIVGINGQFAQSKDLNQFWHHLKHGKNLVTEVPLDHFDINPWFDSQADGQDKSYSRWGSFITDLDKFDASFFNISPREAKWMDPQNRLLLQSIYQAADDAGVTATLKGSNTGVFIGICFDDYAEKIEQLNLPLDPYTGTGKSGITANRVSFHFDLTGPSMVINTACSSSLVALHYGIQALRNQECDMAIIGAGNLLLSSLHYRYFSMLGALSPTGRCHTFDSRADGYVPAESICSIILKPLTTALKDTSQIHGVIKGSAFSHGGYTPSITAPSVNGEAEVLVKAWQDANIDPHHLSYIEAHGTGTKLGDPIEINALKKAFAIACDQPYLSDSCAIGSVKANIGHTEAAAGLTGLLKVVLQLKNNQIAPMAQLDEINPHLRLDNSPLYINRNLIEWPQTDTPRIAGVSSFGFSGAYAHVVIEQAPQLPAHKTMSGPYQFVASANSEYSLLAWCKQMVEFIQQQQPDLHNLCYTLQVGRQTLPVGVHFECVDHQHLIAQLNQTIKAMEAQQWQKQDVSQLSFKPIESDQNSGQIISLPSYCFEPQSHWIGELEPKTTQTVQIHHLQPHWHVVKSDHKGSQPSVTIELTSAIEQLSQIQSSQQLAQHILIVIDNQAQNSVLKAFELIKWLQAQNQSQSGYQLTFVTFAAIATHQLESNKPIDAALHGFIACAAAEHPNWQMQCLDIPENVALEQLSLPPMSAAASLCYRNHQWLNCQLLPIHQPKTSSESLYRQHGVYLIIGGAGGLGQVISEYLIKHHQCQLIWIGRRAINSQIQQQIEQLSEFGPAPVYLSADARNGNALKQARDTILERFAAVHGVFHCAVGDFDRSIKQMEHQQFADILATKVETCVQTVNQFQHSDLDFMLFCSSIAAFTRSGGMSGYSAGCIFTDSLAQNIASQLPFAVKVINWGYWQYGTGNAIAQASMLRLKQQGIAPINAAEGIQAINAHLASNACQQAVVKLNDLTTIGITTNDSYLTSVSQTSDFTITQDSNAEHHHSTKVIWTDYIKDLKQLEQLLLQLLATKVQDIADDTIAKPNYLNRWLAASRELVASVKLQDINWQQINNQYQDKPLVTPILRLLEPCLAQLLPIINGQQNAVDIMFPGGSTALVEGIYKNNPIALHFNEQLAIVVLQLIQQQPNKPIRILEVGAGTGASTQVVLNHLNEQLDEQIVKQRIVEYCFTDISQSFLVAANKNLKTRYPFITTKLFNMENIASEQNIDLGQYDIVIATNCVHATKNIRQSLNNIKSVLTQGGVLLLNEISQFSLISHLSFGLLEGWWQADDPQVRDLGSPGLSAASWSSNLQQLGFKHLAFPAKSTHDLGQQIIIAQSDGLICLQPTNSQPQALPQPAPQPRKVEQQQTPSNNRQTLEHRELKQWLRQLVSEHLMLNASQIEYAQPLSKYGIDSIIITQITTQLCKRFGQLADGLLYEYGSIDLLADYLTKHYGSELTTNEKPQTVVQTPTLIAPVSTTTQDIAIIGISGRFADCDNLEQLWQKLVTGDTCIHALPADRWDSQEHFEADVEAAQLQGKSYCNYGGFMPQLSNFDALFFNISPSEAQQMDPQSRLLLQQCWHALEDAGYSPSNLNQQLSQRCGVWAAVTKVNSQSAYSAMANRISYALNLHGPSMPVDTMCSSALVALHQAQSAIRYGEIDMAIVGAVNLYTEPRQLSYLCQVGMLSQTPMPKVFSQHSSGFSPSEGVAAVVLKRTDLAEQHNDSIYAIIKGSAINHSGQDNAYGTPNPAMQTAVIQQALANAKLIPQQVSYIEVAAMGNKIADALELKALAKVYNQQQYYLGSLKANIGHGEAVSGMAQLFKVVQQLKTQTLCPTLVSEPINQDIDLDNLPFEIKRQQSPWMQSNHEQPLIAGISASGAGGVNAHLLVQQYIEPLKTADNHPNSSEIIVLSAKSQSKLQQQLQQLKTHINQHPELALADIAYTLQIGREAFNHRAGFIVTSKQQLIKKIAAFEPSQAPALRGQDNINLAAASDEQLVDYWCRGGAIDWLQQWQQKAPARRVSLPGYPFEQRHFALLASPATSIAPQQPATPAPEKHTHLSVFDIIRQSLALNSDEIKHNSQLLDLGLDSIQAMQIMQLIKQHHQVSISYSQLLQGQTVQGVIDLVNGNDKHNDKHNSTDSLYHPLSLGQKGLWYVHQLTSNSTAYNVPLLLALNYSVNPEHIVASICDLIKRHPILSARFSQNAEGQPQQSLKYAKQPHQCFDFKFLTQPAELQQLAQQPFDLANQPLMRVYLCQVGQQQYQLLMVIHHIVIDGSSVPVLLKDFLTLLSQHRSGQTAFIDTPAPSYIDFISKQQQLLDSPQGQQQMDYWLAQLQGELPALALPYDRVPNSQQQVRGAIYHSQLDIETSQQLRKVAKHHKVSLFALMLSLYKTLLFRYCDQQQLIVGVPTAGRSDGDFNQCLGYFINVLPISSTLGGNMTFSQVLSMVNNSVIAGLDHSDIPLPSLVSALNKTHSELQTSHKFLSPIFQTSMVMQNFWRGQIEQQLQAIVPEAQVIDGPKPAGDIELRLEVIEQSQHIEVNYAYNADLFEQSTISQMAACFIQLASIITQPQYQQLPLVQLPLINKQQQQQLINVCQQAKTPTNNQSLLEQIAIKAAEHSKKIAVSDHHQQLNYQQLLAKTTKLAALLQHRGVKVGDSVGISTERSVEQIIAVLAVIKAGGVCLPLDPYYPTKRLHTMLDIAKPSLILTSKQHQDLFQSTDCNIAIIDSLLKSTAKIAEFKPVNLTASSLIYMLFTSGSTGLPKGIKMPHRAINNLIQWQNQQANSQGCKTLQFASLNFDVSFQEIFSTLTTGGHLVLISEQQRQNSQGLMKLIDEQQIERVFLPYVALNALAQVYSQSKLELKSLHTVITAGEALKISPAISAMFTRLTQCRLHNHYGPSESHVVSTYQLPSLVSSWSKLPPIGKAINATELYILDRHLNMQPQGVAGELYISGECLALGYLGDQQMTAAKFIDDPFTGGKMYASGDIARILTDGNIEYLGRKDRQYKVAGYRIETAEIEAAILSAPKVEEALVTIQIDGGGFNTVHAYVVISDQQHQSQKQLHQYLTEHLPHYMMPASIKLMNELPVTASGKLDSKKLIDNHIDSVKVAQPPKTEIEIAIHTLWCQLLKQQQISTEQDFFVIGGHSLLLVSLLAKINQQLCPQLSLAQLYQHTTIASLATCIERLNQLTGSNNINENTQQRHLIHLLSNSEPADRPKLFCLPPIFGLSWAYSNLANYIDAYTVYGIDYCMESHSNAMHSYIAHITAIQPQGPITLLGFSAGGTLAYQLASALEQTGRKVADIIILDSLPVKEFKQQITPLYQPDDNSKNQQNQAFIEQLVNQYAGSLKQDLKRDSDNQTIEGINITLSTMAKTICAYLNDLLQIDESNIVPISANIHLLYSTAQVEQTNWEQYTHGHCQRLQGVGEHMDMLFAEHGKKNARIINQLLINILLTYITKQDEILL